MDIVPLEEMDIDAISDALLQGATIVYPTETCYGIGCDATNQQAVDKVFEIKKRQRSKSVLVVMPDEGMALEYVDWNGTIEQLAQRYWPGPLTIVAPLKKDGEHLAEGVFAEDGTLAFRVTDHPVAYELSSSIARPLVSTSANIESKKSAYDIASVLAMCEEASVKPDIIIDAGPLQEKSPSTIVRVMGGKMEILRQGELIIDIE